MLVSSPPTCPNPALYGPTPSLMEMTPIEPTLLESTLRTMESAKPFLTGVAGPILVCIGLAIVEGLVHHARMSYLTHKLSSIALTPGSQEAFLRDEAIKTIQNAHTLALFTSPFPQKAYVALTHPNLKNVLDGNFITIEKVYDSLKQAEQAALS